MKFQELDKVRVCGPFNSVFVGTIMKGNESAFGETYWVGWDDGRVTLMHADNLEKANVDFQVEKP